MTKTIKKEELRKYILDEIEWVKKEVDNKKSNYTKDELYTTSGALIQLAQNFGIELS